MTIVPSDLCTLADKIYFETKPVYKVIVKAMPVQLRQKCNLCHFSAQNREHSLQSREKLVKLGTTNLWTFVNTAVSVNKTILSQVWETSISFIEKSLVQNLWTFVNVVSMNRIILSQMCEISISFIEELSLKFVNICEDVWESSSYMNMTNYLRLVEQHS